MFEFSFRKIETVTAQTTSSTPLNYLLREDLDPDPFIQFGNWLEEARKSVPQPYAMSLATVAADGRPTVRTVLLKDHDENGFVFFTELHTRKVEHISANPCVSLLFPWLPLNRQVIVMGDAQKLSALAAAKYMILGQNNGISNRAALAMQLEAMKSRLASGALSLAPSFCAFRVRPETIEFWQGRGPREHDRFLYLRGTVGKWIIRDVG